MTTRSPRGAWVAARRRLAAARRATSLTTVGVTLGVTASIVLSPAAPAVAGSVVDDERPDVEVTISELTGVLGPGAGTSPATDDRLELRVLVENRDETRLDNARLVTEIYPAVTSQSALTRALGGERVGAPLHVHDRPIRDGTLAAGDLAGVEEAFGAQERGWALGRGGVHPLRTAVVRGTDVLAETTTAVVWLDREVADPLRTAMVWPLDTDPWRGVGGTYTRGVGRDIDPGGRLDRLMAALERRPDSEVVLAPAAHLIEDLRDRADGFTVMERQEDGAVEPRRLGDDGDAALRSADALRRLRDLASALPLQPVSGSYADADLSALRAAGPPVADLAAEAAVEGRRRVQLLLGRDVDGAAHLVWDRIDPSALDLLPGEVVLLPGHAVDDARRAINDHGPVRALRTPSGRLLTVLVADPDVAAALEAGPDAGATETVQRIVAVSALRYLDAPQTPDRGLLMLPPIDWDPSPELADRLLEALHTAPWLEPAGAGVVAGAAAVATTPLELAEPVTGPLPESLADALADASAELTAARLALAEGTTPSSGRSSGELHDALLRSTSSWLRGTGQARAEALVADVARDVDAAFGSIEVAAGAVTLTSTSGLIPITLQRTEGGPIELHVEVASQGRLLWPEGRRSEPVVLEEGEAQTVSFATEAVSTGTFPVTVRITDPSGQHELATAGLSVRSTAISRPALGATGGVVLLLLLAGAVRRRRRPRSRPLELVG